MGHTMPKKPRHTPEQIIGKLSEAEVKLAVERAGPVAPPVKPNARPATSGTRQAMSSFGELSHSWASVQRSSVGLTPRL
jgi:hypothetical protein